MVEACEVRGARRSRQKAVDERRGKATIRGSAREFDVPEATMRRLINEDLGLKSYKRTPRQALKPSDTTRRLARAAILVKRSSTNPAAPSSFSPMKSWPPHGPDLSPFDYGVFGHLKGALSGGGGNTKLSTIWRLPLSPPESTSSRAS